MKASCTGEGRDLADELEERLINFAVRIIKIADALPRSATGTHIASQPLRSGTSPAPNYAEARSAESRADFIHKLKVALKELNETRVWLRMITLSSLIEDDRLSEVRDENQQLCKVINASITTAKSRLERSRRPNN